MNVKKSQNLYLIILRMHNIFFKSKYKLILLLHIFKYWSQIFLLTSQNNLIQLKVTGKIK